MFSVGHTLAPIIYLIVDVHGDHLVEVMPAGFLYLKVISPFVIEDIWGGDTLSRCKFWSKIFVCNKTRMIVYNSFLFPLLFLLLNAWRSVEFSSMNLFIHSS